MRVKVCKVHNILIRRVMIAVGNCEVKRLKGQGPWNSYRLQASLSQTLYESQVERWWQSLLHDAVLRFTMCGHCNRIHVSDNGDNEAWRIMGINAYTEVSLGSPTR